MVRFNKSQTALVLVVTAALCFGFGASTRSNGVVSSKGSVVEVVTVQNIPAYVNRWCLIRDGNGSASPTVAIVEFGDGRSRRRYAYPQPPSSSFAAHDNVSSEIETCSIAKTADPDTHIAGAH